MNFFSVMTGNPEFQKQQFSCRISRVLGAVEYILGAEVCDTVRAL